MTSQRIPRCFPGVAIVAAIVAAAWLLTAASTHAGILKLYKAKESEAAFQSGGQKVKVWQFTPKEGDGPFPGVVVLYGLDCIDELPKSELMYKNVAGKIADSGYVVQLIHYFNCTPFSDKEAKDLKKALLDHVPHMKDKPFEAQLEKPYIAWMAAAKDGVAFIREQSNVDKNRVAVVGLSLGGFIGTTLAVEHPELKLSALANVFGGLPPQQHAKVRKEKMKLPPMFIVGAEDDDIVPERFQRDLFLLIRETGNRGEAHFYGDVGHAFLNKEGKIELGLAMNEALPTTIRFLQRHVGTATVEKK